MSEILRRRVSESIGKDAKVFLENGFRYEGKLTNSDAEFLEIFDYKTRAYKLIKFCNVKDIEVKE